jgi:hypothetical protein
VKGCQKRSTEALLPPSSKSEIINRLPDTRRQNSQHLLRERFRGVDLGLLQYHFIIPIVKDEYQVVMTVWLESASNVSIGIIWDVINNRLISINVASLFWKIRLSAESLAYFLWVKLIPLYIEPSFGHL